MLEMRTRVRLAGAVVGVMALTFPLARAHAQNTQDTAQAQPGAPTAAQDTTQGYRQMQSTADTSARQDTSAAGQTGANAAPDTTKVGETTTKKPRQTEHRMHPGADTTFTTGVTGADTGAAADTGATADTSGMPGRHATDSTTPGRTQGLRDSSGQSGSGGTEMNPSSDVTR